MSSTLTETETVRRNLALAAEVWVTSCGQISWPLKDQDGFERVYPDFADRAGKVINTLIRRLDDTGEDLTHADLNKDERNLITRLDRNLRNTKTTSIKEDVAVITMREIVRLLWAMSGQDPAEATTRAIQEALGYGCLMPGIGERCGPLLGVEMAMWPLVVELLDEGFEGGPSWELEDIIKAAQLAS